MSTAKTDETTAETLVTKDFLKDFECLEAQKTRTTLLSWICYTGFKYSRLVKLIKRLELYDRLQMDPERDQFPRIAAPRPTFMSTLERREYARLHAYVAERRERGVEERQVHCRFYNCASYEVDIIWCRAEEEEDYIFATIPPKRYVQIITFQGHPWIFRKTADGERMTVLNATERVHYPERAPSKFVESPTGRVQVQLVFIKPDIQSTSLRHLCVKQVARCVEADKIFDLKLPINISLDVVEYAHNKLDYVYSLHPHDNSLEHVNALATLERLRGWLAEFERRACRLDFRAILQPLWDTYEYPEPQAPTSPSLKRRHEQTEEGESSTSTATAAPKEATAPASKRAFTLAGTMVGIVDDEE
ncbi:VHL domain-containing protein [Aphelenchoides fujianensis]|nr:VHL domain-containing protein [Aphelenchoides fujianensis]